MRVLLLLAVALFSVTLVLPALPALAEQQRPVNVPTSGAGKLTRVVRDDLSYYLYVPPRSEQPFRLLVVIHGASRGALDYAQRFAEFADERGYVVLSPLFPEDRRFQELGIGVSLIRWDERLIKTIDDIASRHRIEVEKFDLMGFSAGGQFAHRFLYLHPHRLRSVAIGAPGTVTLPSSEYAWPNGIQDLEKLSGLTVDLEAVKQPRILLVVGALDQGQEKLNQAEEAMMFGPTRLGRVRLLHEAWLSAGIEHEYFEIEDVGHQVDGRILETMQGFFDSVIEWRSWFGASHWRDV